jgi:hypothetical protein
MDSSRETPLTSREPIGFAVMTGTSQGVMLVAAEPIFFQEPR